MEGGPKRPPFNIDKPTNRLAFKIANFNWLVSDIIISGKYKKGNLIMAIFE